MTTILVKKGMARFREIPLSRKIFQIFCLVFFAVGIVLFTYGMFQVYFAYRSNSWPSTSGVIRHVKLVYQKGIMRTKGRNLSGTYRIDLGYEYSVEGVKFNNDDIFYGYRGGRGSSEAKALLKKYQFGESVRVYYQTSDPNQSVLEPGIKTAGWYFPAMGLSFLLIAQLGWLVGSQLHFSKTD